MLRHRALKMLLSYRALTYIWSCAWFCTETTKSSKFSDFPLQPPLHVPIHGVIACAWHISLLIAQISHGIVVVQHADVKPMFNVRRSLPRPKSGMALDNRHIGWFVFFLSPFAIADRALSCAPSSVCCRSPAPFTVIESAHEVWSLIHRCLYVAASYPHLLVLFFDDVPLVVVFTQC